MCRDETQRGRAPGKRGGCVTVINEFSRLLSASRSKASIRWCPSRIAAPRSGSQAPDKIGESIANGRRLSLRYEDVVELLHADPEATRF
jgi:hypothetical protein